MLNKDDLDKLLKQLEQEQKVIELSKLINDISIDKIKEQIIALSTK